MTYDEAREKMIAGTRDRVNASKSDEAAFAEAMAFIICDIASSLNNIASALHSIDQTHGAQ